MPAPGSSRLQYQTYRKDVAARLADKTNDNGRPHSDIDTEPRKKKPRSRSAIKLFTEFWNLLGEHRSRLLLTLTTLTLSVIIGLIPLYGTKLVFDNVLWSGHVIDPDDHSTSTEAIRALNDAVARDRRVEAVMLPVSDGITLVRKL